MTMPGAIKVTLSDMGTKIALGLIPVLLAWGMVQIYLLRGEVSTIAASVQQVAEESVHIRELVEIKDRHVIEKVDDHSIWLRALSERVRGLERDIARNSEE